MDSGRLVNFGLSAGVICQWIEKKIRRHAFLEPCDGTRCTPRGKRQVLIMFPTIRLRCQGWSRLSLEFVACLRCTFNKCEWYKSIFSIPFVQVCTFERPKDSESFRITAYVILSLPSHFLISYNFNLLYLFSQCICWLIMHGCKPSQSPLNFF